MPEIGQALREARMRARIDVSEIEAQTKIRAKYLRALENEEWDLLPGPTFVKSFLRTYGDALGLDGKALVEEYKLSYERLSDVDRPELGQQPVVSQRRGTKRAAPTGGGPSRGYLLAIGATGLVIVLLVVGLLSSGSKNNHPTTSSTVSSQRRGAGAHSSRNQTGTGTGATPNRVALSLRASAAVYVCLIGDNGRKVIPGLILQPGSHTATYHARRFEITLGNSAVTLYLDGTPRAVAPSASAIGYSITRAGRRTLPAGQLPTCK